MISSIKLGLLSVLLLVFACPLAAWGGTATLQIIGQEQGTPAVWDQGIVTVTVNGYSKSFPYGQFSTSESIASGVAGVFTNDCNSPVRAHAAGSVITFFSRTASPGVLSVAMTSTYDNAHFSVNSFTTGPSINDFGGLSQTTVGNPMQINGINFGTSGTVTFAGSSPVSASSWGNASITVTVPSTAVTGPVFITTANGLTSNTKVLTIILQVPTVTWSPGALTYGTPLSSAQLNASSTVPGFFTYQPGTGAALNAGIQTLQATFTPNDPTRFTTVNSTVQLVVSPATPIITWPVPAAITGSTALSATQLNAVATAPGASTPLAGNYQYLPAMGSLPTASSETLSVLFVPTDHANYNSATATVPLTVTGAIPGQTRIIAGTGQPGYSGDGGPAVQAQIKSANVMARDSSGNFFFVNGYDQLYNPGVIREVNGASGVITTVAGNGQSPSLQYMYSGYPDGPTALQTTLDQVIGVIPDNIGNIFIFEYAGCRVRKVNLATGSVATIPSLSACIGGFIPDSQGNLYGFGLSSPNTYFDKVDAASGAITHLYGNGTSGFSIDGTNASNASFYAAYPLLFDASGNLLIMDNYFIRKIDKITGAITTVAGNGGHSTAAPDDSWWTDFSPDGSPATSARIIQLEAIHLDSQNNIWLADWDRLRRIDASTGIITTISTVTPGNGFAFDGATNFYIGSNAQIIEIAQPRIPTQINWTTPLAISYGTPLSGVQLNATTVNGVPGTFVYSPPAGTVLPVTYVYSPPAGTEVIGSNLLTVVFTPTNLATYAPSTGSVYLTVNHAAAPTISWPTPAAIPFGTPLSTVQLNATANVPGTFAYSPTFGTEPNAGSQALSVTFNPTDNVTYNSVSLNNTITVNQLQPVVSWSSPAAINYGIPLTSQQLNATASVPGTFTYNPLAGSVLAAGINSLSVNFTPTSSNYTQTATTTTLLVRSATSNPTITNISPNPASIGSQVTIYGLGFGAAQGVNTVMFKGILATPVSWSDTSIVVTIPPGAATGNVVVWNGSAPSNNFLFMIPHVCSN